VGELIFPSKKNLRRLPNLVNTKRLKIIRHGKGEELCRESFGPYATKRKGAFHPRTTFDFRQ
jgi:hypothetical protein